MQYLFSNSDDTFSIVSLFDDPYLYSYDEGNALFQLGSFEHVTGVDNYL